MCTRAPFPANNLNPPDQFRVFKNTTINSKKHLAFQRTVIRVWRLSSDFVNYLPFEVFRHLTTEKQWCRPHTLPGIAYCFELKGGVSLTYINKNEAQLCNCKFWIEAYPVHPNHTHNKVAIPIKNHTFYYYSVCPADS